MGFGDQRCCPWGHPRLDASSAPSAGLGCSLLGVVVGGALPSRDPLRKASFLYPPRAGGARSAQKEDEFGLR